MHKGLVMTLKHQFFIEWAAKLRQNLNEPGTSLYVGTGLREGMRTCE